jgi:DNA-binding PadR family transcriptional regulator
MASVEFLMPDDIDYSGVEVPTAEMELRWLAAACLLARHSGQPKQQVMLAFRTNGLGSHAVSGRTLREFRVRGWLEVRDGARGDGRERVLYLSAKGRESLRRALEAETMLVSLLRG